jgi:hypothetical protein
LAVVGCCWLLLAVVGCCWLLLAVVGWVFYIYGRFWSLSAKWSPKNGLYNIVYGRLEKTNKILNVSNLKM